MSDFREKHEQALFAHAVLVQKGEEALSLIHLPDTLT